MTIENPYGTRPDEQSFARAGAVITPHDDNELTSVAKGLWIASEGTVKFLPVGSTEPIQTGELAAGTVIPFFVRKVFDTGTDATVVSLDE